MSIKKNFDCMWFVFILSLLQSIKWSVLMFIDQNAQLSNYLGEFVQYFGPKIFGDICIAGSY